MSDNINSYFIVSVVALTKIVIAGGNTTNCCVQSSERAAPADSLKRPFANVPENTMTSAKKKFLPCKDREYDPNKHCGVIASDTGMIYSDISGFFLAYCSIELYIVFLFSL